MKASNATKKIINHLESLTKEELISLILQFAPQSFFDAINSQFASQRQAKAIFKKVVQEINAILSDEILLYSPSKFENKLLDQLEKLRGLWSKLPSEIGGLILKIMRDVEQAFEDGYLYIEKYGEEDDYFESEKINDYIFRFVSTLPNDIKPSYVEEMEEVLEGYGYSTFFSVAERLPKS